MEYELFLFGQELLHLILLILSNFDEVQSVLQGTEVFQCNNIFMILNQGKECYKCILSFLLCGMKYEIIHEKKLYETECITYDI